MPILKTLRDEWLKEMRNPDNTQCIDTFVQVPGRCCALGWLLSVTPGVVLKREPGRRDATGTKTFDRYYYAARNAFGHLDEIVLQDIPRLTGLSHDEYGAIVEMNDTSMKPLAEIADWIEADVEVSE